MSTNENGFDVKNIDTGKIIKVLPYQMKLVKEAITNPNITKSKPQLKAETTKFIKSKQNAKIKRQLEKDDIEKSNIIYKRLRNQKRA